MKGRNLVGGLGVFAAVISLAVAPATAGPKTPKELFDKRVGKAIPEVVFSGSAVKGPLCICHEASPRIGILDLSRAISGGILRTFVRCRVPDFFPSTGELSTINGCIDFEVISEIKK
jgi:hypothetical protein